MARCKLVGGGIGAAVFAREGTVDKRGRATVWHDDGLPDACRLNCANVLLLEVLKEAVLWAEKGGGRDGEDNVLFPTCEVIQDLLAWKTRPLDRVPMNVNVV